MSYQCYTFAKTFQHLLPTKLLVLSMGTFSRETGNPLNITASPRPSIVRNIMNFKMSLLHAMWRCLPIAFCCGSAYSASYLPLVTANTWTLSYQNQPSISMSLRVLSTEDVTPTVRRAHVLWNTPWGFSYTMVLRSSSAGIEHEGFIFDTGATSFPNPMPLFPEGAAGQSWVSAFGTVTLVSKTATVVTPAKTYTKARHYRIAYWDGSSQSWYLGEGIGYIQFGEVPMGFPLSSTSVKIEPVPIESIQTPGPLSDYWYRPKSERGTDERSNSFVQLCKWSAILRIFLGVEEVGALPGNLRHDGCRSGGTTSKISWNDGGHDA
jgi:hypothetical protein